MVDRVWRVVHTARMLEVRKTDAFATWFDALRDRGAKLRIQVRIDRLAFGNPGQHRVLAGAQYVSIAHAFVEGAEPKFINGLLDAVSRDIRG